MTTDFAQQAVLEFFQGRGRFAARDEYVGMEASRIPELFTRYFEQLVPADQQAVAGTITRIALGQQPELAEHVPEAARLMVDLVVRSHAAAFAPAQADLERELTDPTHLERWSKADDATPPAGLAFHGDWHYPLQLWGVLYSLGSPRALEVYEYLHDNARSARFRQALALARGVYDRKRATP